MTSTEWLWEQIDNLVPYQDINSAQQFNGLLQQAKEMHKQEIIDAYYQCGRDNFEHIKVINRSATEYYQETFKNNNNETN